MPADKERRYTFSQSLPLGPSERRAPQLRERDVSSAREGLPRAKADAAKARKIVKRVIRKLRPGENPGSVRALEWHVWPGVEYRLFAAEAVLAAFDAGLAGVTWRHVAFAEKDAWMTVREYEWEVRCRAEPLVRSKVIDFAAARRRRLANGR